MGIPLPLIWGGGSFDDRMSYLYELFFKTTFMRRMTYALAGLLTVASLRWLKVDALIPAPPTLKCVFDKEFERTEHSTDRNSSHWIRIRRVQSSNPGSHETDWGFFVISLSSRQTLCWI